MSGDLIFEEPPRVKRVGQTVGLFAWLDELRNHPDVWVKFPHRVSRRTGQKVRRGWYGKVERGEFDSAVRRIDTEADTADLYVKYVGHRPPDERHLAAVSS